jgi:hypothetical protein
VTEVNETSSGQMLSVWTASKPTTRETYLFSSEKKYGSRMVDLFADQPPDAAARLINFYWVIVFSSTPTCSKKRKKDTVG